jgi:hypothetical protein
VNTATLAHASRREELLERCQLERSELIAMTAAAAALAPRARAWVRSARALVRLLRLLVARAHP